MTRLKEYRLEAAAYIRSNPYPVIGVFNEDTTNELEHAFKYIKQSMARGETGAATRYLAATSDKGQAIYDACRAADGLTSGLTHVFEEYFEAFPDGDVNKLKQSLKKFYRDLCAFEKNHLDSPCACERIGNGLDF